jgi:hypothetical protein
VSDDFEDMLENSGIPVYQGVNTLCAHCGQPVGDSLITTTDCGVAYRYCSDTCRHDHEWETS